MGDAAAQPDVTPASTEATPDTLLTGEETQEPETPSTDVVDGEGSTDDNTDASAEGADEGADTDEGTDDKPQDYADFNLPEGMSMDEGLLTEVLPVFKEAGITQDVAQKLIDIQSKQVMALEQGKLDAFNQLNQEWKDASINDKEFGGDKFDQTVANAKAALDSFGTPELTKLLNETGIGNNPEVIRFMNKVGALTQEDSPGNGQQGGPKEKSTLEVLYPTSS